MSYSETLNAGRLFLGGKAIEVQAQDIVASVSSVGFNRFFLQIKFNNPAEIFIAGESSIVDFYLSSTSDGSTPLTLAPLGGLSVILGGLIEEVSGITGKILSDQATSTVSPAAIIEIEDSLSRTCYLVLIPKTGKIVISDAITFV